MIKCHNTSGDTNSVSYKINLPYYGGGLPKEWLFWKDKRIKAKKDQNIDKGSQRYTFTERLLLGDAKDTVIGRCKS